MVDSPGELAPDDPGADDGDDRPAKGAGLSWSWDSDSYFDALLNAVRGAAPWLRDSEDADHAADVDPEADEAAYQEAVAAGRGGGEAPPGRAPGARRTFATRPPPGPWPGAAAPPPPLGRPA